MKKIYLGMIFALALVSSPAVVSAQETAPSAAGFTGTWVMDRVKTGPGAVPERLLGYRIIVGQNENLLNVKSRAEGNVEVVAKSSPRGSAGYGENTAGRGGTPSAAGVSSVSSRPVEAAKANYSGTLALYYTPNEVTYNLSGEEAKVEIMQGDKVSGIARIKAKLDKNGKGLQFSTVRRMRTNYGEVEIIMREAWKLSDDGLVLKLTRTVETPTARDQIIMMLTKAVAK